MTAGTETRGLETDLTSWAFNKYDEISKSAFDAYEKVDLEKVKDAPSFNAAVVQLLGQAGAPQDFLTTVSGENVGTDDWLDAFNDMAVQAEEWAENTAVAGVLGAMGLSGWIPAAESVIGSFRTNWKSSKAKADKQKMGMLQIGQWLYINNGKPPKPVPGWKEGLGGRRRLWGNLEDPAIKVQDNPGDRVTVGFYMGPANRKGRIQVFNFDVFREQEVHLDDVAPCGIDKIKKLESNSIMAGIRDLKSFRASPEDTMEGGVPTDPGTEVIYGGELYHIVRCEGGKALIEDEHGQRKVCSLDKLKKGRVTHTNSWNYRQGAEFMGGFSADGAARIYAGQWVWVPARYSLVERAVTTHELACVWKIQEDGVYCFLGIDGAVATVDEVWPLHDDLADVLNKKRTFLQFKEASVTGGDTVTRALGPTDLLVCLGRTEDSAANFPTELTPGEKVVPVQSRESQMVGDGGQKDQEDAGQEIAAKAGIAPGEVERAQEYEEDDRMIGTPSSGNSLVAYAVMAGAALLVFNSVDFSGALFA